MNLGHRLTTKLKNSKIIINRYLVLIQKTHQNIKRSNKNIPYIGEYIFRVQEFFEYLIKYKKFLKKNRELGNKYKGKRVFIVANGPSLSKLNLQLLRKEYTITVNSMVGTPEFHTIKPNFHVIVDYVRFDENNRALFDKLFDFKRLKHKPTYVFPIKFKDVLEKHKINYGIDIIYLHSHAKIKRVTDINLAKRIPMYANVTNAALNFAIYLGFSEIYLVGVDMTGIVKVFDDESNFSTGGHFYTKNMDKKEQEYVKELQSSRSNEAFLSAYAQTFRAFRFTNDFAQAKGIKIFNATRGGTLDVFPRVKYEKLFKK